MAGSPHLIVGFELWPVASASISTFSQSKIREKEARVLLHYEMVHPPPIFFAIPLPVGSCSPVFFSTL